MRGKFWNGPRIGILWMLIFMSSIWTDYRMNGMIHVHALFIIPVLFASYLSGRYWGFAFAVGMPLAHGIILQRSGVSQEIPQIYMGMGTHIATLSLVAELVHRVTAQKRELLRQKLALADSLAEAKTSIKILRGLLPICSGCKSIREDNGYWKRIEDYLQVHSELEFSHGICPDCVEKLYPEFAGVVLRRKTGESGGD